MMVLVERWSLLIVREALAGASRFPEFQSRLNVDPNLLASRLDDLISFGVMTVDTNPAHPEASEYLLTAKGRDLRSAIDEFQAWSARWAEAISAPDTPSLFPTPVAPRRTLALALAPELPDAIVTTLPIVIEISVLGTFALRVGGQEVGPLSVGSQRLLVFLALNDRSVGRAAMAGRMWPDATDEKAGISLRSALSRLDAATRDAILVASAGLRLAETVIVDLRGAQALARRLLQADSELTPEDLGPHALAALSSELLPDWYDDWVVGEAEDWRQLRLNALEALAALLTDAGRLADAAGAARAAMKVEPLRESANTALIRVHLAEGNQSEALRVYDRYRELLSLALGLEPTELLTDLITRINNRQASM
ncbi:BTAD domain-containing putative transcriptional regulator [Glaciihabitans sp. dw_435]|uniref:BTAD domain-containing putative transcriptional regulator n=1 Tax=Glaciihabitans sp. dw_435 TaxID=2720081 RepID=UPI001BD3AD82|nr:BTAD domain-containing putative transcriptional regulator [Glaciihabitans sp. dw_435]